MRRTIPGTVALVAHHLVLSELDGRVCQGGVRETDAIRASIDSFTLLR